MIERMVMGKYVNISAEGLPSRKDATQPVKGGLAKTTNLDGYIGWATERHNKNKGWKAKNNLSGLKNKKGKDVWRQFMGSVHNTPIVRTIGPLSYEITDRGKFLNDIKRLTEAGDGYGWFVVGMVVKQARSAHYAGKPFELVCVPNKVLLSIAAKINDINRQEST